MGIKHIPDGQDFSSKDFADSGFGFSGSSQGYDKHPVSPPYAGTSPTSGPHTSQETTPNYAHGGHVHPHGHEVMRVEHHPDGRVVHHHKHGGHTVHHSDGHITHHTHDGSPAHHMAGGSAHTYAHGSSVHSHPHGHHVTHVETMRDGGEMHHHAHGGHSIHHADGRVTHHDARGGHIGHGDPDAAQDRAMVSKGVHQHEAHMHKGEHETDLHLARGGMANLPGMGMRHKKPHKPKLPGGALNEGSALNRPPRNPQNTTTPRNAMPGGQMGMGVEPSAEPDVAGSEQGIPQMSHGGRHRG